MLSTNTSLADSESSETQPLIASTDTDQSNMAEPKLTTSAKLTMFVLYVHQFLIAVAFTLVSSLLYASCTRLLKWTDNEALAISLIFQSFVYVSSIIGGILADISFGCYKISFLAMCISMIGQAITFTTFAFMDNLDNYRDPIRVSHLIGIFLIAIGQGIRNVSVIPLGMRHMCAEELSHSLSIKRKQMYLRWYVFFYCLGMLFSNIFLSTHGWLLVNNDDIDHWLSLSVPLWCTGGALFILIIAKRHYPPDNVSVGRRRLSTFLRTFVIRWTVGATGGAKSYRKQLVRLIGLQFLAFSILGTYLSIYSQSDTTYLEQIRYISGHDTPNSTTQPYLDENMSVAQPAAALVTIIVLSICSRSKFTKWCIHWYRVAAGMLLASISVSCATGLQNYMIQYAVHHHYSIVLPPGTLYWTLPEYILLGISLPLYFVGGYEMCYDISEKGLETFTIGNFLGVGSLFGIILYLIFSHIKKVYYLPLFIGLTSTGYLGFGLFIFVIIRCVQTKKSMPNDPMDNPYSQVTDTEEDTARPVAIWENF